MIRVHIGVVVAIVATVSVSAPVGATVDGVATSIAGFAGMARRGPFETVVAIDSLLEFESTFGGFDDRLANPFLAPAVAGFFANGGRRCWVVRVASGEDAALVGDIDPISRRGTGVHALAGVDEVSIVCAPGVSSIDAQQAIIAHCEDLGDRVAILDTAPNASASEVLAQRSAIASAAGFGALYHPWVVIPAPGGESLPVPPSGHVAGIWARVDAQIGSWRSPVGSVQGVTALAQSVSVAQYESLNAAGVSAIREFPGRGIEVFGARTVSSDSDWRYVPVRRFAVFLEESIAEGTSWAVFEPNDEPLWASLRDGVEDFLLALWRDGALEGTRTSDAFFVRVDRTTMSAADIAAGRTIIVFGAAVVVAGEFVILRVVHERDADRPRFVRGDANGDLGVDISDAVRVLEFLFLGGTAPGCADAADTVDEGELTVSAGIAILDFLFRGGAPPAPPYPDCGEDPTADGLPECRSSAPAC